MGADGSLLRREADVSARASPARDSHPGVDVGQRLVVPLRPAPHADRLRADRPAAAARPRRDPPAEGAGPLRPAGRADENARGFHRRADAPRLSHLRQKGTETVSQLHIAEESVAQAGPEVVWALVSDAATYPDWGPWSAAGYQSPGDSAPRGAGAVYWLRSQQRTMGRYTTTVEKVL